MKRLALAIFVLFSTGAFASAVKVNPVTPIVMTSDFQSASGEWVQAPWIRANFTVDASETLTFTGVKFTVTCKHGYTTTFDWPLPAGGVEVTGGTSYTLPLAYLGSLGHVDETEFMVHMDYEGWVGKADLPTGRLNLSTDFVTQ
jgi:hypothetical protein